MLLQPDDVYMRDKLQLADQRSWLAGVDVGWDTLSTQFLVVVILPLCPGSEKENWSSVILEKKRDCQK